ncbi:MAG: hypothetical protein L3J59_08715 [Methylococcaceae bacterium]|nr:hypothetical protein [Methylococcaceae bacterium]
MGVFFGIINIIVAVWFYSSATSVKKQAIMWAVIGGLSFLFFKYLGYSVIGMIQGSLDQAILGDLVDKGYSATENSAGELSSETSGNQSTALGIFYEFFPLIVALSGVAFIRAKFILGMGYIASLKHKTPIKLVTKNSLETSSIQSPGFVETLSSLWKKIRRS